MVFGLVYECVVVMWICLVCYIVNGKVYIEFRFLVGELICYVYYRFLVGELLVGDCFIGKKGVCCYIDGCFIFIGGDGF